MSGAPKINRGIATVTLAIIILLSLALIYCGYYGVLGSDEVFYSELAHMLESRGFGLAMSQNIDATKYLTFSGTALFFKLLGPSNFSYVLYGAILYAATIVVIFLIGNKLRGSFVGLLASFIYATLPLGIYQVARGGDDSVMAFFASTAILFFLYAMDRKQRQALNNLFSLLTGFTAIIGILSVSEEVLVLVPMAIAATFLLIKSEERSRYAKGLGYGILGIIVGALAIVGVGYFVYGRPAYIFSTLVNNYNQSIDEMLVGNETIPFSYGFDNYMEAMFPNMLSKNGTYVNNGVTFPYYVGKIELGWYFYLAVVMAAVALLRKDKSLAMPGLWALSIFIYLSFGTMSLSRYVQIDLGVPFLRYLMIIMPAISLIIALGLFDIATLKSGHGRKRTGKAAYFWTDMLQPQKIAVLVVIVLFVASNIYSIDAIKLAMYNYTFPFPEIGSYVNTLPKNSSIAIIWNESTLPLPVQVYTDYDYNFSSVYYKEINCSMLHRYNYFITILNSTLQNMCNLTLVYKSPQYAMQHNSYSLLGRYNLMLGINNNTIFAIYKTK